MLQNRLPEFAQDPAVLGVVAAVIIILAHLQRGLSWREYQTIHTGRLLLFPILQRRLSWKLFESRKHGRDDDEYVTTVDLSPRAAFKQLVNAGASPHLLSSVKYRENDAGREYAVAHVIFGATGTQTEVWLFEGDDGTDVYAHKETHVTDPEGHVNDPYEPGDPDGHLAEVF